MEDTTTYTLGLGQELAANWSGFVAVAYDKRSDKAALSPLRPTDGRLGYTVGVSYQQGQFKLTPWLSYQRGLGRYLQRRHHSAAFDAESATASGSGSAIVLRTIAAITLLQSGCRSPKHSAQRRNHVGRSLHQLDQHALAGDRKLVIALGVQKSDVIACRPCGYRREQIARHWRQPFHGLGQVVDPQADGSAAWRARRAFSRCPWAA
jgi:hypothetical protein